MSKNHFVSHFLPFQINTTIFIFVNFFAFAFLAISMQHFFVEIFTKWPPAPILDVRNLLWITFLTILDQYRFFIFLQNGCQWPFWMSENYFRSHFWAFQIDTQLYFLFKFLTKWLTSAILDVRISLSIAFMAISDRFETLIFF